jgi:hypothetical protein
MRISGLAMIVAFGITIAAPALAQQSAEPSQKMQPDQQMQNDADRYQDPQLRRIRICK